MNSRSIQIILGLIISVSLLSTGIIGGAYYIGVFDDVNLASEESNYSEVKIVESSNYSTVSEETLDSVVSIYGNSDDTLSSQGSGFKYSDGYIMTNYHVIDSSDEVKIKYAEGEWSTAHVVGGDVHTDIAILEPETIPSYAEPLNIKTEGLPSRGDSVLALGSPGDLGGTVTTGVISGVERTMHTQTEFTVPDSIQTDAALNPGNSGGPLVSAEDGTVLGVNTATEGENIGFAVSSRLADSMGKSLISTGEHEHSYIGIRTVELTPLTESDYNVSISSGLVIEETISDSPNSDLFTSNEIGDSPDVIVSLEGSDITTNENMTNYIMRNTEPGDTVSAELYREGEIQQVEIELGSR